MKRTWERLVGLVSAVAMFAAVLPISSVLAAEENLLKEAVLESDNNGKNGTKASAMFDGDMATEYQSWSIENGANQTYILDLGAAKTFNRAVVHQGITEFKEFLLSVEYGDAADGDFTSAVGGAYIATIHSGTDPKVNEKTVLDFEPVTARYVKFVIAPPGKKENVNIAEIQLFHVQKESENLLQYRPVIEKNLPSAGANSGSFSRLFDGDETTQYKPYSGSDPIYVVLDLGEKREFNCLKARTADYNPRKQKVKLSYAEEYQGTDTVFTPAEEGELQIEAEKNAWYEQSFPEAMGRYVKLTFDEFDSGADNRPSFSELQLYNKPEDPNRCIGAEFVTEDIGGKNSTKASAMFDGDMTTEYYSWSIAKGENQTYILDLGEAKIFNRVAVHQGISDFKEFTLSVEYGDAAEGNFTPAVSGAYIATIHSGTDPKVNEKTTLDFEAVTARYVKFVIASPAGQNVNVAEIQLFHVQEKLENLLQYRPVIEKNFPGVGANSSSYNRMFDGDETTEIKPYSSTESIYVVLDLGQKKEFNQLKVRTASGNAQKQTVRLFYAEEYQGTDTVFIPAEEGALQVETRNNTWFEQPFPNQQGRYVKLTFDEFDGDNRRPSFSELQLYNMPDTTPPEITLLGEENMSLEIGDTYSEPGYSALDDRDGDLTENVVVSGDAVDTGTKGIYHIYYNVSDAAGNAAQQKIRTVSVGIDGIPPVITLKGAAEITLNVGENYEEPGFSALDDKDGDLTSEVVVSGDAVDTETVGNYIIRYDVQDRSGNAAQTVTRTVHVVDNLYGTNWCIGAEIVTGDNGGSQSTKVSGMFDGDKETRYRSWQAQEGQCTGEFILNLGEAKQFNQLVIIQANKDARLFTLTLQTGETVSGPWTNVTSPIDVPKADGGVTTKNFAPVSAQYVRFYIDKVEPGQNFFNIAELQLSMDEASYKISRDLAALTVPSKTGVSLKLPSVGAYGSAISWKSSNETVMDAAGNLTGRPGALEGKKTVHLTATLTFGETVQNAEFDVEVVPQNIAENAVLSGMENAAALGDADYTTALLLMDKSEVEAVFATEQLLSRAEFVLQDENHLSKIEVFGWNGSSYNALESTINVTDEIAAVEFTRGKYEKIKFRFHGTPATTAVELLLGLTDRDAVEYLAEILTVTEEPLTAVTKDLILQTYGEHGQSITWSSSNTAAVKNNGTVIRQEKDTKVCMTATISKGEASKTVPFNITVLKKENPSGGSQGRVPGGSSGGGSGNYIVPKNEIANPPGVTPPQNSGNGFRDLPDSHWAYSYIGKLADIGVVSGNSEGNFEPERTVTRAEYVKMLVMTFGLNDTANASGFTDVAPDAWYASYIAAAQSNGIIYGNEQNQVLPEAQITREDMAVMLGRVMEATGNVLPQNREYAGFSDQTIISGYAADYVWSMYCAEIIDGTGGGAFEPKSFATRAQAAKVIVAALEEVKK